jgi:2-amino-4-hydroxy-6-hydroxymethyldihydropteridine diphosphokinase
MPQSSSDRTPENTVVAFLGLGASVGDRLLNLQDALGRLQDRGIHIIAVSSVYESPHMGLARGDADRYPAHLNIVAKVETSLTPEGLLDAVQATEMAGGRQRLVRWGPRTIDIDILDYNGLIHISDRLILPHPGIAQRAFVARPLVEVEPEFTLRDGALLRELLDQEPLRSQRIARTDLNTEYQTPEHPPNQERSR